MDIAIILGLILLNGVFAMSEIAIVSSRQARLQQAVDNGSEGARSALALAADPTRFLSTIQVGITLIGILAGAFGEASIARRLEAAIIEVDWLAPYAGPLSWTLMVIIITYLSLIFGELVPKRLALLNPEGVAKVMARPMNLLSRLGKPLVLILGFSTDMVLRLLRAKKSDEPPVTEEEIHSLMRQGQEAGVLEAAEHEMLRNVLHLDELRLGNIMTLRREIYYIDLEEDLAVNRFRLATSPHSRVPLCRGGIDQVIGILYAKDVVAALLQGQPLNLAELAKEPIFISRMATPFALLETIRQSKMHLAIVRDEQGHTSGLVTLNDIMEAIAGSLPEGSEEDEPDFVQREDGTWLVSGLVDVATFKDQFGVKTLPEEESGHYHTLGGLILTVLDHLPKPSDVVQLQGLRLEVLDMDGRRVDKVLVSQGEASEVLNRPDDEKPEVQAGD